MWCGGRGQCRGSLEGGRGGGGQKRGSLGVGVGGGQCRGSLGGPSAEAPVSPETQRMCVLIGLFLFRRLDLDVPLVEFIYLAFF